MQDLSASLEAVYGQATEGTNSEETLKKFYDWKCNKREELTSVRSETEVSLQHLVTWFQSTLKVARAVAEWCHSINRGIRIFKLSTCNLLLSERGRDGERDKKEKKY